MSEKKYPEEFKREMVRQFHGSGQTQTDYAKKNGLKVKTFSRWVREDWSQRPKEEQDHMARIVELEKQNRELRMEREILKKAAAFFAKESR